MKNNNDTNRTCKNLNNVSFLHGDLEMNKRLKTFKENVVSKNINEVLFFFDLTCYDKNTLLKIISSNFGISSKSIIFFHSFNRLISGC